MPKKEIELKSFLKRMSWRTTICSEPVTLKAFRRKVALRPVLVEDGKTWVPMSNQPADKGVSCKANVHTPICHDKPSENCIDYSKWPLPKPISFYTAIYMPQLRHIINKKRSIRNTLSFFQETPPAR